MLTNHERRVLYVLRKNNGGAKAMTISQAMARTPRETREAALRTLEEMGLISSAKTPPQGRGRGALVYWLTKQGKTFVQEQIDEGKMKDPDDEPRARKGAADAAG